MTENADQYENNHQHHHCGTEAQPYLAPGARLVNKHRFRPGTGLSHAAASVLQFGTQLRCVGKLAGEIVPLDRILPQLPPIHDVAHSLMGDGAGRMLLQQQLTGGLSPVQVACVDQPIDVAKFLQHLRHSVLCPCLAA